MKFTSMFFTASAGYLRLKDKDKHIESFLTIIINLFTIKSKTFALYF